MADLISLSCSVCCEARLMPSQRSWSFLLHIGGGTNWCTLGATGPRWARLDARSSLQTSGTFCTSASSSDDESHADFWELKNSLSRRRMMFGDGDLTSFSSVVGGLGLEMTQFSMVIQGWLSIHRATLWAKVVTCKIHTQHMPCAVSISNVWLRALENKDFWHTNPKAVT